MFPSWASAVSSTASICLCRFRQRNSRCANRRAPRAALPRMRRAAAPSCAPLTPTTPARLTNSSRASSEMARGSVRRSSTCGGRRLLMSLSSPAMPGSDFCPRCCVRSGRATFERGLPSLGTLEDRTKRLEAQVKITGRCTAPAFDFSPVPTAQPVQLPRVEPARGA